MLNSEMLTEIKKCVKEEEGKCVKYAQWLFDLNYKPNIITEVPKPSPKRIVSEFTSTAILGEVIINPLAITNDLNLEATLGYPRTLKDVTISHLSHEIGHDMFDSILGRDYVMKYRRVRDIGKNMNSYKDTVFVVGVSEAVAYYNENNALCSYGIRNPVFRNKMLFDDIYLNAYAETVKSASLYGINDSIFLSHLISQCQLIGREYFERELKEMKPKEFRKWVKNWRPERANRGEKIKYLNYLEDKVEKFSKSKTES